MLLYCGRVPAANAPGCTAQTLVFSRSYLHLQMSPPETLVVKGGTTWLILPENFRLLRNIQGSFTCRKSTTCDRRLYFTSERSRAEFLSPWKNPTASAGFEPTNLGTKGQHATSRPPKPLSETLLLPFIGELRYLKLSNLWKFYLIISMVHGLHEILGVTVVYVVVISRRKRQIEMRPIYNNIWYHMKRVGKKALC